MGHSRGGEGMRQALNIYGAGTASAKWKARIPGLKVRAIFEIGPVDLGTDAGTVKVDASEVAWNALIPGCDRDVSEFTGINPFERVEVAKDDRFPKSIFTLWGANHNFFNAQWQVSDAPNGPHPCSGNQKALWDAQAQAYLPAELEQFDFNARAGLTGSEIQMKFEKALLLAFFHSHLGSGKELKWDRIFDPRYRLPRALSTLASSDREYLMRTGSKSVFDMSLANTLITPTDGLTLKTLKTHIGDQLALMTKGLKNLGSQLSFPAAPEGGFKATLAPGAFIRSAAVLEGRARPGGYKIVLPFDQVESSEGYWTFDMALAMRKGCYNITSLYRVFQTRCEDATVDDNFEIALVLADGSLSRPVKVKDYVMIGNGPGNYFQAQGLGDGGELLFKYTPLIYQTARMDLTDFSVRGQSIKGVQFSFTSGDEVSLVIESMRLTRRL